MTAGLRQRFEIELGVAGHQCERKTVAVAAHEQRLVDLLRRQSDFPRVLLTSLSALSSTSYGRSSYAMPSLSRILTALVFILGSSSATFTPIQPPSLRVLA